MKDLPVQKTVSADAVRMFHEAVEYERQGDIMHAYQLLLASISEDPTLSGPWHNLGFTLHKMKKYAPAAAAFYRACQLAPIAMGTHANYAWNLHHSGRTEEALLVMEMVVATEPKVSMHWTNISQIYLNLSQYEKSLEAAQKAVDLEPENPMGRLALALSQLRSGNYKDGLLNYEARFPYILPEIIKYPYPIWRGEDISDKRLFIPCEQGIGDSVMFMRFLPEAIKRAKKTIIHTHDQVLGFYEDNLFPRAGSLSVEIHPIPKEMPAADVFCPMMSLPIALGLSNEDVGKSWFSYTPPPQRMREPRQPGVLRVGICWAGDPKHDNDRVRSATLEDFLPLAEVPNVQLYSLQVGYRSVDVDTLGTHAIVKNLAPHIKTVGDTAALAKHNLDVIVTVDTATAHIAGSVGAKIIMLNAEKAIDWRWGTGEGKSVWYPSMTMLRQQGGGWKEVINRVRIILRGINNEENCH